MQQFAYEIVGRLVLTVHGTEEPDMAEWQRYVDDVTGLARKVEQRVIVYSTGGGPNGAQRDMVSKAVREKPGRVALITRSLFMRSVGSAMRILVPTMRVFSPNEISRAFAFLELNPLEQREAIRVLEEVGSRIGVEIDLELGSETFLEPP